MGKYGNRDLFLAILALVLVLLVFMVFIRPHVSKPEVIVINKEEVAPKIITPLERDYTVITCNDNIALATTHLYNSNRILISIMRTNITCDSGLGEFYINKNLATKQNITDAYLKNIFYI